MIRNIQLKHAGKYVCMVQTSVDKLSAAADLIVRGMGILGFVLKIYLRYLLQHRVLKTSVV